MVKGEKKTDGENSENVLAKIQKKKKKGVQTVQCSTNERNK